MMKTLKATDISGLRRRRSRKVIDQMMKETASSVALAVASSLPPGSRSLREGRWIGIEKGLRIEVLPILPLL
ncbi:hypothetical protein GW17_00001678 [Ensete ventricosum]|nr:hypothetical protein GW17_00001678 [Ensete ventricosum]